jgi:transposase-like protein
MQAIPHTREENGMTIAHIGGYVRRVEAGSYVVRSQSGNGEYQVISGELGWLCSCPDHLYRGQKCKHIWAVHFSLEFRKTVAKTVTIKPIIDTLSCPRCKAEKSRIKNDGIRHNRNGNIQRYECKECGKRFSYNIGFQGMRATPQMITTAMQLYFSGESLRSVQDFLKLQGLNMSHVAVYRWIKRYVKLMDDYLVKMQPSVSGIWRTDEIFLRIKGKPQYIYAMLDDDTRMWLAMQVSPNKATDDVRPMFQQARDIAGKKPDMLISDGAPNFHDAYLKEYWSKVAPRTSHVRHIHMAGDHNNNKMERMNGEVRDREKVMRGLKSVDSPILKGYQLYHNHFRGHDSLSGKTPGEMAGIKIEGRNKWITLIENASKDIN